jgi:hypothetical protein
MFPARELGQLIILESLSAVFGKKRRFQIIDYVIWGRFFAGFRGRVKWRISAHKNKAEPRTTLGLPFYCSA